MLGVTNSAANNIQPSRGVEPSSWQTIVNQAQTAPQSSWDKFVGLFKTPTRSDSVVETARAIEAQQLAAQAQDPRRPARRVSV